MTIAHQKINIKKLPPIKFLDLDLRQSDKMKYLGCILDNRLTFCKNLSAIKRKLFPVIKNFMTNRKYISSSIAAVWYKSLIRPILEYCAPVTFTTSESNKKEILTIENRCLKIISSGSKSITRANFYIPSVLDRLKYLYLVSFFKFTHGLVPIIDENLLPTKSSSYTRLGATGGFLLKTSSSVKTTLNFGVTLFNNLPRQIRGIGFLKEFKAELHRHLLNP
jgi:hypothetical protein